VYEIVDLRSYAAYKQAHIDGAVHIPFEELSDRVGELDGNKIIAFYDLATGESTSLAAAMLLYDLGFTQVVVLDGGLSKWYADGYPIQGTLLTPTPGPTGPPWTVTPIATSTAIPTVTLTPTPISATSTVTPTATTSQ
jgi:rhodanese-related sulfurtransferase